MPNCPRVCLVSLLSILIVASLSWAKDSIDTAAPLTVPINSSAIESTVTAEQLERILEAGPRALVSSFLVQPAYGPKKRFLGFQIVQRTAHAAIGPNAAIKVGDIVVAANGIRLETPAQFMSAWRKLREQKVFVVDILRAKRKVRYRWTLVK